jgi:hypothetical protein
MSIHANASVSDDPLTFSGEKIVHQLNFSDTKYSKSILLDWSSDAKVILFQYTIQDEDVPFDMYGLAVANDNLTSVRELLVPLQNDMGGLYKDSLVVNGFFSPTFDSAVITKTNMDKTDNPSSSSIYFVWNGDFYTYDLRGKILEKLLGNVIWIDHSDYGNRIVYSRYDENSDTGSVYFFNIDSRVSEPILEKVPRLTYFDLSPEGKRILYIGNDETGAIIVAYYDIESQQSKTIPDVYVACNNFPRWTPFHDTTFITYSQGGCSRGWQGGALYVVSLDGQTNDILIEASNDYPQSYSISSDGRTILVSLYGLAQNGTLSSLGKADMYRLELPTPLPEFGSLMLVLVGVAIASALLMTSRLKWQLAKGLD